MGTSHFMAETTREMLNNSRKAVGQTAEGVVERSNILEDFRGF